MFISTDVYYVFVIMDMMIKTSFLFLSRYLPRDKHLNYCNVIYHILRSTLGSKELREHTEAAKYDLMEISFLSGPDSVWEAGVQTTLLLRHPTQSYLLTVQQVHPSLPSLPRLESLFSLIGM